MSDDDDRVEPAPRESQRERTPAAGGGAAAEATASRTGPVQFLREVRSELRKVAWPNRKELISYTIVVLAMTTVLTLVVWGFDEVIRRAIINTLG